MAAPLLQPPFGPDDHVDGDPAAPHVLLMFGDFECPYCAAAQSIVARVRKRMGDELRFAFRHFPIDEAHPQARLAAEASEAAAAQGGFWPMHDALYAARGHLARADLLSAVGGLGLDAARVAEELDAGRWSARVQAGQDSGRESGVTGTPAFFVNGVLHTDAFDAGSLVEALRRAAP